MPFKETPHIYCSWTEWNKFLKCCSLHYYSLYQKQPEKTHHRLSRFRKLNFNILQMFQDWFIIFLKRKKKTNRNSYSAGNVQKNKFKPSLLVLPVLKTEANLVIIQQFQLKFRFGYKFLDRSSKYPMQNSQLLGLVFSKWSCYHPRLCDHYWK